MSTSCALFRASNLEILDYPFNAALDSAMAICDEAVVVVGQSQDNTLAWVMDIAGYYGHRVKIVRTEFTFDLGWQERWWDLAASHTDAEWLLWLDADEVIDPIHAPRVRAFIDDPGDFILFRLPFVHLYATADYEISYPLQQNTRLGKRSAGFRMRNWRPKHVGGAACQMVILQDNQEVNAHNRTSPWLYEAPFPILHYGWCRSAKALALSQAKQEAWYADGDGIEDGRLPFVQPYDFCLQEVLQIGQAKPYTGEHPNIMRNWFAQHHNEWQDIKRSLLREEAV